MSFDLNTINGIIRAVVPAVLAYFVAKGAITSDAVGLIVTAAIAVAAAVWSIQSNTRKT